MLSSGGTIWKLSLRQGINLNESLVPDLAIKCGHVIGKVHVQHEGVPQLIQCLQAGGILGLVELDNDIT